MTEEELLGYTKELIELGNSTTIGKFAMNKDIDETHLRNFLFQKLRKKYPELHQEFKNRKKIKENHTIIMQRYLNGEEIDSRTLYSAMMWGWYNNKELYNACKSFKAKKRQLKTMKNSHKRNKQEYRKESKWFILVNKFLEENQKNNIDFDDFCEKHFKSKHSELLFFKFIFLELKNINKQLFEDITILIKKTKPKLKPSKNLSILETFIKQKKKNKSLTVVGFCKNVGMSVKTLQKYITKLRQEPILSETIREYNGLMQK